MEAACKHSSLTSCFAALQEQIRAIVEVQEVNCEDVVETASELAKHAASYRTDLCRAEEGEKFKQTLKRVEIPLPLAYKTIEILTHPALQFHDALKRELSKTTRIFFELIVCQCRVQGRSLYSSTHEKLYKDFKGMIKTLPEEEVLCRFELKCCRAALKNLDPTIIRAKKIVKRNITPIGVASIQTILSANASPPYVNIAPGLSSILNLVQDVCKSMPEWWYGSVLALKWYGLEVGLQSLPQYKSIERDGKTIKRKLKDCSSNSNIAFYVCQVFREVMDKCQATEELKKELFQDKKLSIVYFAEKKPKKDLGNKFWKVRYLALTYLEELRDSRFNTDASQMAIIRLMANKHEKKIIRRKAYQVCDSLLKTEGEVLIQLFQKVQEENEVFLSGQGTDPQSYDAMLTEKSDNIRFLEGQLQKYHSLKEHSSVGSEATPESLEKNLESERHEYTNLLTKKEQLEDSLSRRDMLRQVLTSGGLNGFSIE